MSRLHLFFDCEGTECAGTLDVACGTTGLLIVSGGNEIRSGAFGGQARLAADLAAEGFPVFRYDRRGIGDSGGENASFLNSGKDIAAAISAFRALAPQITHIVCFGNCDAAAALMLNAGLDASALVLSNPWTFEGEEASPPPPSSIRSRYLEKLANPRELLRLIKGEVNFGKLARGLIRAVMPAGPPSSLALDMQNALAKFEGPVQILLCEDDLTAQAFAEVWPKDDARIIRLPGGGHSYVEPHEFAWLKARLLETLKGF